MSVIHAGLVQHRCTASRQDLLIGISVSSSRRIALREKAAA